MQGQEEVPDPLQAQKMPEDVVVHALLMCVAEGVAWVWDEVHVVAWCVQAVVLMGVQPAMPHAPSS